MVEKICNYCGNEITKSPYLKIDENIYCSFEHYLGFIEYGKYKPRIR